jgi:hypothetical protein
MPHARQDFPSHRQKLPRTTPSQIGKARKINGRAFVKALAQALQPKPQARKARRA